MSRVLARLSVRLKVTLAFSVVIAVLLAGTGMFVYLRLERELGTTVDRALRSRAADVSALVAQADSGLADAGRSPLTERGESLAQIVDGSGRVVDASPGVGRGSLLSAAELTRARRATILVSHATSPIDGEHVRLLATPVRAQGASLVVVVGASVEPSREALDNLRRLLLIGGPIALLLAALTAYGAVAAALGPVEAMRRQAAEIQASTPGRRLPVPPSGDEVARLGETLNDMLGRLEDALEREQAFTADASHELRTPLAIVTSELELALRDATSVDEYRAAVRSAAGEAARVVALAEDLLILARSDEGALPVHRTRVGLRVLLEDVRLRFEGRASERAVTLDVDAPDDLVAMLDELRVEQAVGNLVDNALRHGGGAIVLSARSRGGALEIHVTDEGPGFRDDFLPRAFERFARADTARHGGGTGLGLSIVAAIAAGHGGSAHAANRPEGGADLWLVLPA